MSTCPLLFMTLRWALSAYVLTGRSRAPVMLGCPQWVTVARLVGGTDP